MISTKSGDCIGSVKPNFIIVVILDGVVVAAVVVVVVLVVVVVVLVVVAAAAAFQFKYLSVTLLKRKKFFLCELQYFADHF